MFFTIKKSRFGSSDLAKIKIIADARFRVLSYPMRHTEQALDIYLKQNYKQSLKQLSLKIALSCSVLDDFGDEFTVVFNDKIIDKLANLITYGNSEIKGSDIIKFAFKDFNK